MEINVNNLASLRRRSIEQLPDVPYRLSLIQNEDLKEIKNDAEWCNDNPKYIRPLKLNVSQRSKSMLNFKNESPEYLETSKKQSDFT